MIRTGLIVTALLATGCPDELTSATTSGDATAGSSSRGTGTLSASSTSGGTQGSTSVWTSSSTTDDGDTAASTSTAADSDTTGDTTTGDDTGEPLEPYDPPSCEVAGAWAQTASFESYDIWVPPAPQIAFTGDGELLYADRLLGALTLGGIDLVAENRDLLLAKLAADGSALWIRQFSGVDDGQSRRIFDVAAGPDGSAAIFGYFGGSMDFGAGERVSPEGDVFVAKFAADGELLWDRLILGDAIHRSDQRIAIDTAGDVLLLGNFEWGSITFGDTVMTAEPMIDPDLDVYFAKLDGDDGSVLWSKHIGEASLGFLEPAGLSVTPENEVFAAVIGNNAIVDFGGGALPPMKWGLGGVAFARFSADGELLWERLLWEPGADFYRAHASLDAEGNILFLGSFAGSVDLGGGELRSTASRLVVRGVDLLAAKLTPAGDHLWSRRFGRERSVYGQLALDPSGDVILAGRHYGTDGITFGGPVEEGQLFVTRLAADTGDWRWGESFDCIGQCPYASKLNPEPDVAVAPDGRIALAGMGSYPHHFKFDALEHPPEDGWIHFVASFEPELPCEPDAIVPPTELPPCPGGPAKYAFTTSAAFDGAMGGLEGADAKCQALAAAALLPGTYRAWLSDSDATPSTRFEHSPGPYLLPDGTEIAGCWDDLTDAALDHPIDMNELGGLPAQATSGCGPDLVWSGPGLAGRLKGDICMDWTSTEDGDDISIAADPYTAAAQWTLGRCGGGSCASEAPIYCFQQ